MSRDQLQSLDNAQREFNRVLELLARLFVAVKGSDRSAAITTATRLKQVLPATTNNYHKALDLLDEQLQHAKLILRRDLALATEQTQTSVSDKRVVEANELSPRLQSDQSEVKADDTSAQEAVKAEPSSLVTAIDPVDTAEADTEMTNANDTKQDLKVDTTQAPDPDVKDAEESSKAPDTALSANADMDSLFNDPISAGGLPPDDNAASTSFDLGTEANASNDFNFADFTAGIGSETGGDGLSMIPGLQDFTTGAADEPIEPDFSALFGPPDPAQTDSNTAQPSQIFSFDDMMDFNMNGTDNTTMPADSSNNEFDIAFS